MALPNRLVAALVYNGLCNFEFSCAAEVFGLPRPEFGPDWYRFATVAAEDGVLRGEFGFEIHPDAVLADLRDAGTVIVPGWKDALDATERPVRQEILDALRAAHARGARLLSVCSGAYVLAAAGLLDGKRATTHWRYIDAFRKRYPRVEWDPDVLYIDEGQIITSAGSAAGLDASLHLVRRDHGGVGVCHGADHARAEDAAHVGRVWLQDVDRVVLEQLRELVRGVEALTG